MVLAIADRELDVFSGFRFVCFLAEFTMTNPFRKGSFATVTSNWTIARPVILTNGPKIGRYRVLVEAQQWRNGLISRWDVADFLIKQGEDDMYFKKAPVLAY